MNRAKCLGACLITGLSATAARGVPVAELGLLPGDASSVLATNSQQEHAVAKGGDNYLVVWTDYRGRSSGSQTAQSDGDIFGVRLNAQGNAIDASPFLIAGGMGLQQHPRVGWNGSDWLVLYTSQDPVGGYYGDVIHAVRVSSGGQILDATPITFPPTIFEPSTIGLELAGMNGQWLASRCIYHEDGYGTYLAGQRISAAGQLLDQTPLVLNDWVYGPSKTVVANGEYLVAAADWYDGTTIKARRIGPNGQPIGASFSVPSLNIASSGTEFYVSWIKDYVNLVGSRMTNTGTLLTPAGTVLVSNFSSYTHSTLAHDGTNWWLEWGVSDILRTVRINSAGTVLDPNGGVLLPIVIGGNVNTAYDPVLLPRTGGGVHVFWYDLRVALNYDTNVYVLPVNASNVAGTERCVSTSTPNQRNPDLSVGPAGGSAVVFVSEGANDDRVVVHLLNAAGVPMTSEPIEVYRGPNVGKAGIAWNGSLFMVAWDQGYAGTAPTGVKARRLNPDGSFVDAQPIAVMNGFNADIEALGNDFLVAAGRVATYPQTINLWAGRVDGTTGASLDGPSGLLLGGGYANGMPRVRSDGSQWLVAAHTMWSHDSSQGDAILAKVSPSGVVTPAANPTPFSGASGDLDIAFNGSKYLLVWRMNSLANANNYVAGRIMNADGSFQPGYFIIAEATGRQLRPAVEWDGTTFVVAWDDQRNQGSFFDERTDVYSARVTETGEVLDIDAFPVCASPNGDASPAMLSTSDGSVLIATARFTTTPGKSSYRVGLTRVGTPEVAGDANGDLLVNGADLSVLLSEFGMQVGAWANADFNGDGWVNSADLSVLLGRFGQ